MKGWCIKNIINNPIGYIERDLRNKIKFWKNINKLSSNFEESDLSCSILEKYEKELIKIDKYKTTTSYTGDKNNGT